MTKRNKWLCENTIQNTNHSCDNTIQNTTWEVKIINNLKVLVKWAKIWKILCSNSTSISKVTINSRHMKGCNIIKSWFFKNFMVPLILVRCRCWILVKNLGLSVLSILMENWTQKNLFQCVRHSNNLMPFHLIWTNHYVKSSFQTIQHNWTINLKLI